MLTALRSVYWQGADSTRVPPIARHTRAVVPVVRRMSQVPVGFLKSAIRFRQAGMVPELTLVLIYTTPLRAVRFMGQKMRSICKVS
jgi:hypothetical protein